MILKVAFAYFTLQVQGLKASLAVLICLGDEQLLRHSYKMYQNVTKTGKWMK